MRLIDDKEYYIVDGRGNYYRVNTNDQLVVAGSREEAGVFGYFKANQRIGRGKKAHFYSVIPAVGPEEPGAKEEQTEAGSDTDRESGMEEAYYYEEGQRNFIAREKEADMTYPYNLKCMDWKEYLIHFCYIVSGISDYQEELNRAVSNIDMQICDIMHFIELYDLDAQNSVRLAELLKECREQRRDVKDEMYRVECFQKAIGTSSNAARAKDSVKQMEKLNMRVYHPRKLQELFEVCPEKTIRTSKLAQVFAGNTCMDREEALCEQHDTCCDTEEGEGMNYRKQRTVFDGKENNWGQFARQQAEFYENANQYIYNLQEELEEIDGEIEQTLRKIETANYNVAQGYKVFKYLKELRNEKKEKQKELECVSILTEGFDCGEMAEALRYCADEIEAVLGASDESATEEVLAG